MTARLLVIDDHEVARRGIAKLLSRPAYEIVGSVSNGKEAFEFLDSATVDAILLDVRMPDSSGLSVLEKIKDSYDTPVVIVSAYDNPTYVARAAALGAHDYIIKNGSNDSISSAISRAIAGSPLPEDSCLLKIQQAMRAEVDVASLPAELPLTSREAQVLRHIALGLSNKEIARSLAISVETVKEHVQNILRKIGANDRTDAAVRAVKLGLIE
ncbi:Transcriptional regulatory protein DegU [Rubripirellula amarantea]|uniref:Transcriptional regulatory protein DegU n=1 Tax=Rubripirellula amarantea TaxID=2527999 RepID=A0A5C5WGB3_9BACT|nr:response regulator transcription factor [Rubripirellula amarantea]TWT49145.1 Transcriptional regulatory protein DegU [Rubripirellula amarantea]